jgi:UDP-N-acetylmuramoyl-tripeptide--D-alanyl-D-alanine ligase
MTRGNRPLWTLPEIARAVGGEYSEERDPPVTGVSIDSRSLEPGDLFIALSGSNHDAHDHLKPAFARGAAAAIVTREVAGLPDGAVLIRVADAQQALEAVGMAARARSNARIAAVTGSVGKTGTKEMLALALAAAGPTHRSVGSYNNLWGVPLSLARMPREAAFGVFEIGMNHAGEIAPLTRMVRPEVAIITTVELAHLEFFDGVEAIADAKAEIFQGVTPGGTAILNRDNALFGRLSAAARMAGVARIVDFGSDPAAAVRLLAVEPVAEGSVVTIRFDGRDLRYRLGQPGRHLAMNSLAVVAAAAALGVDPALAAAALGQFGGLPGRGKRLPIQVGDGTALLIDESYNASPAAMRAALSLLGEAAGGGRRIAVLGDMRELGRQGPALHAALVPDIVDARIDLVFACGPLMREMFDSLPPPLRGAWAETAAALHPVIAEALRPDDILMVKGSLGSRMADIVNPLAAGAAAAPGRR